VQVGCPAVCPTDTHCKLKYGLGMFVMDQYVKVAVPGTGEAADALYYGHGGQDYGSGSAGICGFNIRYRFGFCVNYNSYVGMNCSAALGGEAFLALDALGLYSTQFASCQLYAAALTAHGGPALDCKKLFPPPPPPPVRSPCYVKPFSCRLLYMPYESL
jgi:hypothetical protein